MSFPYNLHSAPLNVNLMDRFVFLVHISSKAWETDLKTYLSGIKINIYECLPWRNLLLCQNDSHKLLGNKHVTFSQTDCHGSRGTVEVNNAKQCFFSVWYNSKMSLGSATGSRISCGLTYKIVAAKRGKGHRVGAFRIDN